MKIKGPFIFYQVQYRRGWWNLRERGVPWGIQEKILGVKEGSPKHFFKFCIDGICNDANSLPEYQKPVFLTSRKFRFSLGNMPPAPYFIVHQKAILPHQNVKFACHHINKPIKTTWPWPSVLCLWQFKTSSSHFSYFLHPFSLSLFFLSFFGGGGGGGGGGGKAISINWDTRGPTPNNF